MGHWHFAARGLQEKAEIGLSPETAEQLPSDEWRRRVTELLAVDAADRLRAAAAQQSSPADPGVGAVLDLLRAGRGAGLATAVAAEAATVGVDVDAGSPPRRHGGRGSLGASDVEEVGIVVVPRRQRVFVPQRTWAERKAQAIFGALTMGALVVGAVVVGFYVALYDPKPRVAGSRSDRFPPSCGRGREPADRPGSARPEAIPVTRASSFRVEGQHDPPRDRLAPLSTGPPTAPAAPTAVKWHTAALDRGRAGPVQAWARKGIGDSGA